MRWQQWVCPVRGQGWSYWGASCCSRFCRPGWVRRAVGWGPAPSGYSSWSKRHCHNSFGQKMGRKKHEREFARQKRQLQNRSEQRGFVRQTAALLDKGTTPGAEVGVPSPPLQGWACSCNGSGAEGVNKKSLLHKSPFESSKCLGWLQWDSRRLPNKNADRSR